MNQQQYDDYQTTRYSRPASPIGSYPYTPPRQVPAQESILRGQYKGQGWSVDFICKLARTTRLHLLRYSNLSTVSVDEVHEQPKVGNYVHVVAKWCDEQGFHERDGPHYGLAVYKARGWKFLG